MVKLAPNTKFQHFDFCPLDNFHKENLKVGMESILKELHSCHLYPRSYSCGLIPTVFCDYGNCFLQDLCRRANSPSSFRTCLLEGHKMHTEHSPINLDQGLSTLTIYFITLTTFINLDHLLHFKKMKIFFKRH